MNARTVVDPRERSLPPDQEEIDAWAAREHARPSSMDRRSERAKRSWMARRYRLARDPRPGGVAARTDAGGRRSVGCTRATAGARHGSRVQPKPSSELGWRGVSRRERGRPADRPSKRPRRGRHMRSAAEAGSPVLRKKKNGTGPGTGRGGGLMDELMSSRGTRLASICPKRRRACSARPSWPGRARCSACRRSRRDSGPTWCGPAGAFEDEFHQQPRRRRVRY